MVRGLDLFIESFKGYTDQYVLIGGSACFMLFQDAGLDSRRTKDLDVVLCLEALTIDFVDALMKFIAEGRYLIKERSSGKKVLYRFNKPENEFYPAQIELFTSRVISERPPDENRYTPIKIEDHYTSLSALLLDESYYKLILEGKTLIDGASVLRPEVLIVLKAKAWLDMLDRQAEGEQIKQSNIDKHGEDIFRLLRLLSLDNRFELADNIQSDVRLFAERCSVTHFSYFSQSILLLNQEQSLTMLKTIFGL